MNKQTALLMILISVLSFGIHSFFAFSSEEFSSDKAYFQLREIKNINAEGSVFYEDPLDQNRPSNIFVPIFQYIIALLAVIMPVYSAAKIGPAILISLTPITAYLLSKQISKNEPTAIFTAFGITFIPIILEKTINQISPNTIIIPLFMMATYAFMKIKEKKYLYTYFVLIISLSLLTPLTLIFAAGIFLHFAYLKIERLKPEKEMLETGLLSLFFAIWTQMVLHKNLLHTLGAKAIYLNIPQELIKETFAEITLLTGIYKIGALPFLASVYIIYNYLFKKVNKELYLIFGIISSIALASWLQLVPLQQGLLLMSAYMMILFAHSLKDLAKYLSQTKAAHIQKHIITGTIIIFVLTSIIPSIVTAGEIINKSVTKGEKEGYTWLNKETAPNSIIITTYFEGNTLRNLAERTSIIDDDFLKPSSEKRYEDIQRLYTTPFITEAVRIMNRYEAEYVVFTKNAQEKYKIIELRFIEDSTCFEKKFENNDMKIYQLRKECET